MLLIRCLMLAIAISVASRHLTRFRSISLIGETHLMNVSTRPFQLGIDEEACFSFDVF
jgi:hypothetical protein